MPIFLSDFFELNKNGHNFVFLIWSEKFMLHMRSQKFDKGNQLI